MAEEDRRMLQREADKKLEKMSEQIDKIYKLLYENGLVAQVKYHGAWIKNVQGYVRVAITTIIISVIGFILMKIGISKW